MTDAPSRPAPWVVWLVTLGVLGVGALFLHLAMRDGAGAAALIGWSVALAAMWLLGWWLLQRLAPGREPVEREGRWIPRDRPIAFSIALAAGFALLNFAGAFILLLLPGELQDAVRTATGQASDGAFVLFLVATGTGIAEEMLFRVGMSRILPGWWFPAVSTALYFVVTLASTNVALALAAVPLGLVASVGYMATHRWYTPVLIHVVWSIVMVGLFPLVSAG